MISKATVIRISRTMCFVSCNDDDEYEDGYELLDFHIIGGRITPKP